MKKPLNSFQKINKKTQEAIVGYAMIIPAFVLLLIFVFIPLIIAIYRSFFETTINSSTFIGFKYYIKTITNKNFILSIPI